MKVTKVVYTRTKQVAQYEPEKIELEIELDQPGDTVAAAVSKARATMAREWDEDAAALKAIQDRVAQKQEVFGNAFE